MEVGTRRKRAAEEEADDSKRTARGAAHVTMPSHGTLSTLSLGTLSAGKHGKGMLALSLLLAEGATVLHGQSQSKVHDQFIDGRGCFYLNLSTLDTVVTVEEPDCRWSGTDPRRSASTTSTLALSCHDVVKE
eukprot:1259427-Amphidinium_carterae.1